jgi:septal ring factor EnvC (AmiA/AmiB activator)
MSGTVNYPKVIDHLTDVIKELNVPCAEPPAAEPSAAERQADAAALLRDLLDKLESHGADARAAAAAEHSATADQAIWIKIPKKPPQPKPKPETKPETKHEPKPEPKPVAGFQAAVFGNLVGTGITG